MNKIAKPLLLLLAISTYEVYGSCPGLLTGIPYDLDWGIAPPGIYTPLTCLTITNDKPHARQEVAYSSIPVSQSLNLSQNDLDRMVIIGANNKRVPSQMVS